LRSIVYRKRGLFFVVRDQKTRRVPAKERPGKGVKKRLGFRWAKGPVLTGLKGSWVPQVRTS